MRTFLYSLICLAVLTACTDFPQLDTAVSEKAKTAPYPSLVPADNLLEKRDDGRITAQTGPDLIARAERLRARAELIRGIDAINEETRIRIRDRLRALGG